MKSKVTFVAIYIWLWEIFEFWVICIHCFQIDDLYVCCMWRRFSGWVRKLQNELLIHNETHWRQHLTQARRDTRKKRSTAVERTKLVNKTKNSEGFCFRSHSTSKLPAHIGSNLLSTEWSDRPPIDMHLFVYSSNIHCWFIPPFMCECVCVGSYWIWQSVEFNSIKTPYEIWWEMYGE